MKKVIFLLLMIVSIFGIANVNASSNSIELTRVDIENKSDTITVNEPIFSLNEITSNITFNKINDYVEFKLTFKNIEDKKLKISSISDNLDNDNIEISYTYDTDTFIGSKKTTAIKVRMTYNTKLINVEKLSINDLKIIIKLISEDGKTSNGDIVINPITRDNIICYVLLLSVSLTVLVLVLVKKKIKDIKLASLLIVLGLVFISFSYALKEYEGVIEFKDLIVIGELEEYKVTFDSDGGTLIKPQTVVYNGTVTKPEDPVKEGYTFVNWYLDDKVFDFNTKITEDITLKAKYTINQYTVKFETYGGIHIPDQLVAHGQKVIRPTDPTWSVYRFINWYTGEDYETKFDFDNTQVTGPLTIYSKWNMFPTLFRHNDDCVFNGHNEVITGDDCEYAGQYYVDTNILLYSQDHYNLDFELGLTLKKYDPSENISQATLVNAKYENEMENFPGFVVRRASGKDVLEVSQTIDGVLKNKLFNPSIPTKIKVYRVDGILYYSENDNIIIEIQDINDTFDHFDRTVWFGASQALKEGKPQREFKGIMSNMYIKLGKYKSTTKTVTFNPNGGTVSETTRSVESMKKIGELPVPEYDDLEFLGWYTKPKGGTLIKSTSLVAGDVTLYAHWKSTAGVAKMNGEYYPTVQAAVNAAPNAKTTIVVLDDVEEKITIASGKDIELDLRNNTISYSSTSARNPAIENKGKLEIKNGTVTNSASAAVLNNQSGASLVVDNVVVEALGNRQGIYNNGGALTITGSSTIKASASERAAIHSLSGNVTILSGTVLSSRYNAIDVEGGTLTIGTKNNTYNTSSIIVQGEKYGINTSVNISVYDGIIKGIDDPINNESKITNTENNSTIVNGNETIDSKTYKTLYYVIN